MTEQQNYAKTLKS